MCLADVSANQILTVSTSLCNSELEVYRIWFLYFDVAGFGLVWLLWLVGFGWLIDKWYPFNPLAASSLRIEPIYVEAVPVNVNIKPRKEVV